MGSDTAQKHTEGPWEIVEPFGHGEYVKIIGGIDGDAYDDGRPKMISTHVCDVIDNCDEEANAKLIAAAPEMAAALKRALSWLSSYPGGTAERAYLQAVDALKKAGCYE